MAGAVVRLLCGICHIIAATIGIISFSVRVVMNFISHTTAAVGTEHKSRQSALRLMRAVLYAPHSVLQSSLCLLPKLAVNNRLVGVLKHKAFLIGGKASGIGLEICSDCLSQHSMTEIFLPVQNLSDSIGIPPCTAEFCFSVALLRVILQGVRRGYQHLFFGKLSCDCCRVKSLRRKFKDVFYHLRSNRIDHQSLLIFGQSVVAVGNTAGAAFSVVHTG